MAGIALRTSNLASRKPSYRFVVGDVSVELRSLSQALVEDWIACRISMLSMTRNPGHGAHAPCGQRRSTTDGDELGADLSMTKARLRRCSCAWGLAWNSAWILSGSSRCHMCKLLSSPVLLCRLEGLGRGELSDAKCFVIMWVCRKAVSSTVAATETRHVSFLFFIFGLVISLL